MDLGQTFRQHLPAPLELPPGSGADLAARLRTMVDEGRSAWPGVDLDEGAFVRHLAQCMPADEPLEASLDKIRAADLWLACACLAGDEVALLALEQHHLARLDAVLARFRFSSAHLDEVKQLVRQKLLVAGPGQPARIGDYAGWAPLAAWLRVIAVRTAISLLRKSGRECALSDDDWLELPATQDDPELAHLKKLYRSHFKAAFARALADLQGRERNLLRFSYLDGLSIDAIGAIYQVHRATAARWLVRVRDKLLRATRQRLQAELALSQQGLDSILGLINSNLEVSLNRFLGEAASREADPGG